MKVHLIKEIEMNLIDFFAVGLSFKLLLEKKKFPPVDVFNDFLRCGRDDVDSADQLMTWEPFEIDESAYAELIDGLVSAGHVIHVETSSPHLTYQEWFETLVCDG